MIRWLGNRVPTRERMMRYKSLRPLGKMIYQDHLWACDNQSMSKAFAIGMFCAFVPLPMQMVIAAVFAVIFNANVPTAIALTWITNPLTGPLNYYLTIKLGAVFIPTTIASGSIGLKWILDNVSSIFWPYVLGSFIVAICSGVLGYLLVIVFFLIKKKVNS